MIYKYYSPNKNNLDALAKEYFWCSSRKFLNDPFDSHGDIVNRFPLFKAELKRLDYIVDEYSTILDKFGICSFSKNHLNKHLWALYAASYSGWALEFDNKLLDDNLSRSLGYSVNYKDITYLDTWPNLDDFETIIKLNDGSSFKVKECFQLEINMERLFEYLLFVKEKSIWENEEEKRLSLGRVFFENNQNISNEGYRLNWPSKVLTRIIVGHNIDSKYLEKIRRYAKNKKVALHMIQIVNSGLGFELTTKVITL